MKDKIWMFVGIGIGLMISYNILLFTIKVGLWRTLQ